MTTRAFMTVSCSDGSSADFLLDKPEVTIGRNEDCDVVLDAEYVSRVHACLRRNVDGFTLEVVSPNGVLVNDEETHGVCALNHLDVVAIGECRLQLSCDDVVVLTPRKTVPLGNTKACPFCGEEILSVAKKCKHCGEFLHEKISADDASVGKRVRYGLVAEITGLVRFCTGLGELCGFRMRDMIAPAFRRHSREELEAVFECGGRNTPELRDVSAAWPLPWVWLRLLGMGIAGTIVFIVMVETFENTNAIPGLFIVGAFAVPFASSMLFYELNILRNLSLYQMFRGILLGGTISLLVSLVIYDQELGQWLGAALGAMSAGIVEETGKLLTVVFLARGLFERRWILDGVALGAAVGAGFAGFETAGYIFNELLKPEPDVYGIMLLRALFAPFGHVVWSAATAGALFRASEDCAAIWGAFGRWRFWRQFLFVMFLHALWNSGVIWQGGWISLAGKILCFVGSWQFALLLVQEGFSQITSVQRSAGEVP